MCANDTKKTVLLSFSRKSKVTMLISFVSDAIFFTIIRKFMIFFSLFIEIVVETKDS